MPENSKEPRFDDVVLGGGSRGPASDVVLGGLAGVKRRLAVGSNEVRRAALLDALQYGQEGLDLVIRIVQTDRGAVQWTAWNLLWRMATEKGQQELLNYLPQFTFDVVTVDANGTEISRQQSTAQFFREDLGNDVVLDIVAIPGRSFHMGSPTNEDFWLVNRDRPLHWVKVKPFFMGKYPVTQAQWQAVAALPEVGRSLYPEPSGLKGADHPVDYICWQDAVEFCARLSLKTGRHYRLPSEAEWEYACRARTTTPFHFGETITTDLANYNGAYTYGGHPKGIDRGKTTPVGSFKVANAFGLYDMHGNVQEWCADPWHDNYNDAPPDGSVWTDYSDKYNQERVLRGGSFCDNSENCRSAHRYYDDQYAMLTCYGFRVACSPTWTQ